LFGAALDLQKDVPGAADELAYSPGTQFFDVFRQDKTDSSALAPLQRATCPARDMVEQDLSPDLGILDRSRVLKGGESMAVRIVQLGSSRATNEGLRIGTVRRPPRGVPKSEFASRNYYDVWLPNHAPSEQLVKAAQSAKNEADWRAFIKRYRSEMSRPENSRVLDLLAALSHQTNFSVGCYCDDEQHCHRSVLRQLLAERGASIA
jgi:uncharacterized protein YeaO (DUF488 family)